MDRVYILFGFEMRVLKALYVIYVYITNSNELLSLCENFTGLCGFEVSLGSCAMRRAVGEREKKSKYIVINLIIVISSVSLFMAH